MQSLQDTGEASKEEQASRRMNKVNFAGTVELYVSLGLMYCLYVIHLLWQSFHNSKALKSLRQDIIAGMATKLEVNVFV